MIGRALVSVIIAVGLAACQSEPVTEPLASNQIRSGDASALPAPGPVPPGTPLPDPPKPPPAPAIGGLEPLAQADIQRELEPGAGCGLDENGRSGPLLYAVNNDAIVKVKGRIVHLRPAAANLDELFAGGRFAGDAFAIEIEREQMLEEGIGSATWQATLRIISGKTGFTSFHHRWSCGS